ncbi:MAG: LysR family transcriptional regulator [Desulfobacteraceae bacterium]|nr:LysR family transcriptional regulator [Desulfobacteraceae bacterium]
MELRQLKTFQTVAQFLSFNRAAETLNYAQSTISTHIKALEEELGKPLFDRLGKSVVLTEAGQMLLRYARKMIAIEQETVAQVTGWEEAHGSITIRIPQSLSIYALPPVLRKFNRKYPKVGLHISNCGVTLQQELRSGVVDLAFLLADSIHSQDLKAELIGIEKLFLVSNPTHPLAVQSSIKLKDLDGATVLLPKQDCSYKMQFEQMLMEEGVKLASVMEFNSLEAIKKCVMLNVGITLIPQMAVKEELTKKQLVILTWPEKHLETAILMIRHKNKWLSPSLQAFMDLVRENMRAGNDKHGKTNCSNSFSMS